MFPSRSNFPEHRRILPLIALLAFLLSMPMLGSGLFLDDFEQRIKLLTGDTTNIFQTFRYGDPFTDALIQSGVLPWWTHEATKTNFFRPLAEVFLILDYALWPDNFALMHLHSNLWYVALVLIVGLAYRALIPAAWAAGLAAILFAIDGYHAGAVIWLCNRNVLISMSCALLCLLCHRRETLPWRALAAGLFALGLSSGESALAISGYLLAHEVFLASSGDSWLKRGLRLLPYAMIGLAYLAWWRHAGYGAAGPGFYTDPANDPAFFLQEAIFRAPAYLISQLLLIPAEIFSALETPALRGHAHLPGLIFVWLALLLTFWFFWPLLRRSAQARFFTLGMVIAAIPLCGVTPVSRALWYVGFGATGLIALLIHQYRQADSNPDTKVASASTRAERTFVKGMIVLHFWLSPLLYLTSIAAFDFINRQWDSQTVQLPNASPKPNALLLISTKNYWTDITFPYLKDWALSLGHTPDRPPPSLQNIHALIEGPGRFQLTRTDENRLRIQATPSSSSFITLRPAPWQFSVGETFNRGDWTVAILATSPQGAPTEIEYRFTPGLLDKLDVMEWKRSHFIPTHLPTIGSSREVVIE